MQHGINALKRDLFDESQRASDASIISAAELITAALASGSLPDDFLLEAVKSIDPNENPKGAIVAAIFLDSLIQLGARLGHVPAIEQEAQSRKASEEVIGALLPAVLASGFDASR